MKTAYIVNQKARSIAELPLGRGQVSGMGCEAISLFNILVHFGGSPEFEALLAELSEEKLLWRKGLWGMAPRQMKKYLKTRGFRAKWMSRRKFLKMQPEEAGKNPVIVTCFNHRFFRNGVHSFAVVFEDGALQTPNGYVKTAGTMREATAGRRLFTVISVTQEDEA